MLIVLKFGGSSLADDEKLTAAARRVVRAAGLGHRVIVVVSAQGNTTDRLLRRAGQIFPAGDPRETDAYLAAAEQMSAALMAMSLRAQGQPAISLTGIQAGILTDGVYTDARVVGLDDTRLRAELDRGQIVVVAGFQGLGPRGDTVTLGRGGSDTTAVALAAFLKADLCVIYTDVDGIYDKDPRVHPQAVRFRQIGYGAMLALARQGAQVLHDRSVELAMRYDVPIWVRSSFRPGEGTVVSDRFFPLSGPVIPSGKELDEIIPS